jgi:predicted LPLAT superfamily acyltransferase
MKDRFYQILISLSQGLGFWLFRVVAWGIATGYFVLCPARVTTSVLFYRALYPSRRWPYHLYGAWKQFHRFTDVFLDRFLMSTGHPMQFTHEGWVYLEEAVKNRTGAILLMSHLGTWELAAHQLLKVGDGNVSGMKLLLYMGRKDKEQIEGRQKDELAARGIRIIAVDRHSTAPLDIMEGIKFLKEGGLVSLTGDRRWREEQRVVKVNFLGHEALIPEGPFVFALLAHAPLLVFFSHRTGKYTYHSRALPPLYVEVKNRQDRQRVIAQVAQYYADALAEAVRLHPWEWFHFEPFIGRRIEP